MRNIIHLGIWFCYSVLLQTCNISWQKPLTMCSEQVLFFFLFNYFRVHAMYPAQCQILYPTAPGWRQSFRWLATSRPKPVLRLNDQCLLLALHISSLRWSYVLFMHSVVCPVLPTLPQAQAPAAVPENGGQEQQMPAKKLATGQTLRCGLIKAGLSPYSFGSDPRQTHYQGPLLRDITSVATAVIGVVYWLRPAFIT